MVRQSRMKYMMKLIINGKYSTFPFIPIESGLARTKPTVSMPLVKG